MRKLKIESIKENDLVEYASSGCSCSVTCPYDIATVFPYSYWNDVSANNSTFGTGSE